MISFLFTIEDDKARNKLEEIFVEYSRDMFITAYSILKDYHEAEDIVQNAILRISKNLHKILEVKCRKTRSYLIIIVRNLSLDAYNKRKNISLLEHEEVSNLSNNNEELIEEHIINFDLAQELANYLSKLHQPYADILTLRYYYELTISEIAEVLNISENYTSVRLSRALASLKVILEEEGEIYG